MEEQNNQPPVMPQPNMSVPPQMPQPPMEPALPPVQPPQRGGKKKLWLLIAALLAVIAAGLLWVFVFNKSDDKQSGDNADTNQPAAVAAVPRIFVRSGNEIQYVDESGSLQKFVTLEGGQEPVEFINKDGKTELRYVTKADGPNGSTVLKTYGSITADGSKQLLTFADGVDYYWSNPIASPDGSTVVVEKSSAEGMMVELIAYNTTDGTSKQAYKPTGASGDFRDMTALYRLVSWKDNTTALLQQQTCRQCDGPRLAKLVSLDITTGKTSDFYTGDSEKLGYASFHESVDGKSLFIYGGDYDRMFGGYMGAEPGAKLGNDYIMLLDKSTGTAKQVAEFDGSKEFFNSIVGVAEDGVYVSNITNVKTTDPYPSFSDIELGSYNNVSKLQFVNAATGEVRDVAIESSRLKEKTTINQALSQDNTLFLMLANNNTDKYDIIDTAIDLLSLPIGGDTSELISLLQTTVKDTNQVRMFRAR